MKQLPFASLSYELKKKQTRRERFLLEMEQVVPWDALLAVIEPVYPKSGGRGRQPMPLSMMLRIYGEQQWFELSDRGRRTHSMKSGPCGALPALSWARPRRPMRPRSSISADYRSRTD